MKKTQIEELVSKHTTEVDGVKTLNMDGMAADINTSFNELLEKKMPDMDSAKKEWETEYNTSFLKDLGYETKDALKEKLTSYDGIDIEKYKSTINDNESLKNQLLVSKSTFNGDNEYLDFSISKMMKEDDKLTYADAFEKFKEIKPEQFGTTDHKAETKKHNKGKGDDVSPVLKAWREKRRKEGK